MTSIFPIQLYGINFALPRKHACKESIRKNLSNTEICANQLLHQILENSLDVARVWSLASGFERAAVHPPSGGCVVPLPLIDR